MTVNDKHLEQKPEKSGDHQVAGTPITKSEDNAHQQRQEKLLASKAYRFTKGDNAFTIDMGNGEKVQDKRPMKSEPSAANQAVDSFKNLILSGEDKVQQFQKQQEQQEQGAKSADSGNSAAAVERGMETALRPGQDPNKQYDEKDHLYHDKTGKVVEPPDIKAYGLAMALHTEDAMRYAAYKIEHPEQKPAQGAERGLETALRPGQDPNKQYDEKDHLYHDKTGKVVEPPDIKAYGLAMALHTEDAMRYAAYKIEHPEQKPQGTEKGMESALRPGQDSNKQYDEKDHLWHDKTGKVVEPPDIKAYGLAMALHTEDAMRYTAYEIAQHEQKPTQGAERGMEAAMRPGHQPNKQYDENDHLWHDKTGKVVVPPDVGAYGIFAAAHTDDLMRYTAYEIAHPEPKPTQGTERGMEAAMRPGHQPNLQYDEKDHLWHDKTGKVMEPPDVKAYGVFAAAHTEDVFNYTAWKITHPVKSPAANPDRKLSDGNSDSSTQWGWQSTDT
jgi:DNA-directed RNA polymerase subunit L